MNIEIRKVLESLRKEVVSKIAEIVNSVGGELYIVNIDEGESPILQEDSFDANNSYTLDKIRVEDNELYFDGSSCHANYTWLSGNLDVQMLIGILEFLEDHEDEIEELKDLDD